MAKRKPGVVDLGEDGSNKGRAVNDDMKVVVHGHNEPRIAFWVDRKPNALIRFYLPLLIGERYEDYAELDSQDFQRKLVRYLVERGHIPTPQAAMSLMPDEIAAILKADFEARSDGGAAVGPAANTNIPTKQSRRPPKSPGPKANPDYAALGKFAFERMDQDNGPPHPNGSEWSDYLCGEAWVALNRESDLIPRDNDGRPLLKAFGPKVKRARQKYREKLERQHQSQKPPSD